jgi:phosphonoacetaldehyde hydrolase
MNRIRAVVFDWAGTTVDHGSVAPMQAFVRVFAAQGVTVTAAQARAPMGLGKREHLCTMLRMPEIAAAWRDRHGHDWTDADLDRLYHDFMPIQLDALDEYAGLVPHVRESAAWLRECGIRIGATTGYFREAAERVVAAAKRQGFEPDVSVCVDDVSAGRPAPWMTFRVMEMLNVYPPATVVKIGDTAPDIGEGIAAGVWSVGVVRTGSEVGCTLAEWGALPVAEQSQRVDVARRKLQAAGAHAVSDTLAELPALIADFDTRLQRGEKP